MGVLHSLIIVLFTFMFLEFNYMPGGYTVDYFTSGCCIFGCVVLIVNLEMFMMHHVHNKISILFIFASIFAYYAMFAVVS